MEPSTVNESDNITSRVREFISLFQNSYKFFENMTGVKYTRWRDLQHGKAKSIQADMLEALCTTWPEYAYWFVTGNAAGTNGQTKPIEELGIRSATPESGRLTIYRHHSGNLIAGIGDQGHLVEKGDSYEISAIRDMLIQSGLVGEKQSSQLAKAFWLEFVSTLGNNSEKELTGRALKQWINGHAQWGKSA